jgi:hypothetical protein
MASTKTKRAGTLENETQSIAPWRAHLAGVRVNHITTPLLKSFTESRIRSCRFGKKGFAPASPRNTRRQWCPPRTSSVGNSLQLIGFNCSLAGQALLRFSVALD